MEKLQELGVLPRNLGTMKVEHVLREFVDQFTLIVEQYKNEVPTPMVKELLTVLRRTKQGEGPGPVNGSARRG